MEGIRGWVEREGGGQQGTLIVSDVTCDLAAATLWHQSPPAQLRKHNDRGVEFANIKLTGLASQEGLHPVRGYLLHWDLQVSCQW